MDYNFTFSKPVFGRIVFVLTLDKKAMTERIVIGEANEARFLLERGTGDVFYDKTRPLGTLLFTFEADPERTWNVNAMQLHDSYAKISLTKSSQAKAAKPGVDFLHGKYASENPATIFAALRTWDEYLNCYNQRHGPQTFIERVSLLYRPFYLYTDCKLWKEEAQAALMRGIHAEETRTELWYPAKRRPFECVVAHTSLQPVIFYYLQRIQDWGLHFLSCGMCGKDFLAQTRRFGYCSTTCRKARSAQSKREFDERAKADKLEQIDEAAYNYWYNRLRRIRRKKAANPKQVAVVREVFKVFRKEAVKMKGEVKGGTLPLTDFTGWLVAQQDVIDGLIEED